MLINLVETGSNREEIVAAAAQRPDARKVIVVIEQSAETR